MQSSNRFSYHHFFVVIGLIFGIWVAFVNPPWHSNDEDRHFYNAYNLSVGHLGPQSQGSECGFILPVKLTNDVIGFQGVRVTDKSKLKKGLIQNIEDNPLDPEDRKFFATPSCKMLPFAYIPSALMIKIGGAFKSSPLWLGWWGRIGSLLAYLLITFYAIKITPMFKPLLMMIALSPMALYQSASVSYDGLCLAFLFLFFAILISLYVQEDQITLRQIMLLFLAAFAQRMSKDGYFLMYFSVAFIPMAKFENKKLYFGAILLMAGAAWLPSQLWNLYLNTRHLPPEMPLQKDYIFDLSKNLAFSLQSPMQSLILLGDNILSQGKWLIYGSIGRFGFSYTQLPEAAILVFIAGYIYVALSESREKELAPMFRLPLLALAILNALFIIVGFYLVGTPIGGHFIQGMQGRYFTPLLPFMLAFFFYVPQPPLLKDRLKWFVPVFTTVMLFYTVNFLQDHFYN